MCGAYIPMISMSSLTLCKMVDTGHRLLLKMESFLHFQMSQQTMRNEERHVTDCELHHKMPSCTEEKTM